MRVVSYIDKRKFERAVRELESRSPAPNPQAQKIAARILNQVRRERDTALEKLSKRFGELDKERRNSLSIGTRSFRIPEQTLQSALAQVTPEFRDAVRFAANNIRRFAQWQKPRPFLRNMVPGIEVGQIIKPLGSVGCYVPGGRYPLPSTMLMTVVPAQVAGVPRIVVCSPKPSIETLATAALLEVSEFYAIGGAQAIAALAYGTKQIAPVLKIVGPGNSFVTAAKRLVSNDGACAIDMLAGPTEALIACDDPEANIAMLASDLVSQAEHDTETSCVFLTSLPRLAAGVKKEVVKRAASIPIAATALMKNGYLLVTQDPQQTIQVASRIASEHTTVDSIEAAQRLESAGSLFIGEYSAQAFGDYVTGPNHTLPTGASARLRGGLSVLDFLKIVTVQRVTEGGAQQLAPAALALARAEGLTAHAASILARQNGAAAHA
ncbi:MAG: histidinol dehydrogenase [Acidobacteriaceae bacterium]